MAEDEGKQTEPGKPDEEGKSKTSEETQSETWKAPASQKELDDIIKARVAREREKFKDYDSLKTKASEYDKLEESKKSDLERLSGERDQWKSNAETSVERANRALKRSAVVAEAARQGAANPNLIFSLVDQGSLTIEDDDSVTGVDAAVKELLDREPYLKGSKKNQMDPNGADGGVRTGGNQPPGTFTREQLRDPKFYKDNKDAILAAAKAGQITE